MQQIQLSRRLQEVFLDGKWIANTNFKEQIEQISYLDANKKIGNANSIAQLTFHIQYYVGGVLQVLEGGTLDIKDKYSFDMPEINSESDWQNLVALFIQKATALIDCVKNMDPNLLESEFVNPAYGTYQRNLEGILEHSYYHLGQISLIRKWLANTE